MEKEVFKVEVHLNEHCNLNCSCCDHFSPLAEEEWANFESVEKDLARLSKLVDNKANVYVYLLGGEPLLNEHVTEYMDLARKYFPEKNHVVWLITNGILLPKMDEKFWEACKRNDILIAPSRYKIKIDYEPIYEKCREYGVKFQYFHSDDWVETMFNVPLLLTREVDPKESFSKCYVASRCAFLKEGKIYSCPRVANIYHVNKKFNTNFEIADTDWLDIYKANSYEEIREFLKRPKDFCKHCDNNNKEVVKWRLSDKKLEEWASED